MSGFSGSLRRITAFVAISLWFGYTVGLGVLGSCFLLYSLFSPNYWRFFAAAYIIWMIYDRNTCDQGGRRFEKFRSLLIHRLCTQHFPIRVHKTVELPPDENYIFACFPHGVVCVGPQFIFGYAGEKFKKCFSGIDIRLCIGTCLFFFPLIRELFLFAGMVGASEKSIKCILKKPKSGKAVAIMVGGGGDFLMTQRKTHRVFLKSRKGFCRLALQTGAHLVPVYTFGENEVYDLWMIPKDSPIHNFIRRYINGYLYATIGDVGFLPRGLPLDTVYGAPIKVQRIENPTDEDISQLLGVFAEKLAELFEREKAKYIRNAEEVQLEIH